MKWQCWLVLMQILRIIANDLSSQSFDGIFNEIINPNNYKSMRGVDYCEILASKPGYVKILELVAYNTFLYGCDNELWTQVTEEMVTSITGSKLVKLNGPRFWTIDNIDSTSRFINADKSYFNNIAMVVVGIVNVSILDVIYKVLFNYIGHYQERTVNRRTAYIYEKGKRIYYLLSPSGKQYIMQSASTEYSDLTLDTLHELDGILSLPMGWKFESKLLDADLYLIAKNSIGKIVNDNLFNTYSLYESSSVDGKLRVLFYFLVIRY